MHTSLHPELKVLKRICDVCHSDIIKETVVAQFKIELERLKVEFSNLQKRLETEQYISEKESLHIEEIQNTLEETKEEAFRRDQEMKNELKVLEEEVDMISKDYEEMYTRVEFLAIQNLELDVTLENIEEMNFDFNENSEGLNRKIQEIEKEIAMLSQEFRNDEDALGKKKKSERRNREFEE